MRFLKVIKKDGAYYWITDVYGNRYRVVQVRKWRKLQILQEPSGYFAIMNGNRESKGFKYYKLLFKGKFIIAYYRNEFEGCGYYHLYDEQGKSIYKGKIYRNLPNKARICKKVKYYKKYSNNRIYHK